MGLAAVLALAGGPVCAAALRLACCRVRTSIRVRDSLEQGVSHFYAEVRKLKAALESAEAGAPVLFLLDEILHGTNSRERQVGARWLLRRLLECGALGAVTTHDLELCRLEGPLMESVTQCHFQENVEDGRMTFDYKLRQGPVSGGNALRIMRMLGMGVPTDPDGADV
jgi:DNA mismatch repair ATPase MutS